MVCPKCNKEIENGALFCSYCGEKMQQKKFCVQCGTELNSEMAFCTQCGTAQKSDSSAKKPNGNKALTIGIVAAAILIVIIMAVVVIHNWNEGKAKGSAADDAYEKEILESIAESARARASQPNSKIEDDGIITDFEFSEQDNSNITNSSNVDAVTVDISDYTGSWSLIDIIGEPELSELEYSYVSIFEDGTFSHIMEINNPELWLEGYQGYYGTWYASNGGISLDDGLSMAESYWTYCSLTLLSGNGLEVKYENRDGIYYTMLYEKVSSDPNYLLAG